MGTFVRLLSIGSFLAVLISLGLSVPGASAAEKMTFKGDVFPIIRIRCLECHKPGQDGYELSGLDMRTYDGVMKGTKHGPMIVPGEPFMSNLIVLIEGRARPELRMPHGLRKLSKCEIQMFRQWIKQGAKNN